MDSVNKRYLVYTLWGRGINSRKFNHLPVERLKSICIYKVYNFLLILEQPNTNTMHSDYKQRYELYFEHTVFSHC